MVGKHLTFVQKVFEQEIQHGLTVMSMGLLIPAKAPVIWRGPMMHQAVRQLLRDVMWGELDFLIVDLSPGTGDVQLTLTQTLPLAGAIMVTTPQEVALADVVKGAEMFRQLNVPVLGVVENMSYYLCPHCGQAEFIFGEEGGKQLSQQLGVPLLGQVPLDTAVRRAGDKGVPIVLAAPDSPTAHSFCQLAKLVVAKLKTRRPVAPPTINGER